MEIRSLQSTAFILKGSVPFLIPPQGIRDIALDLAPDSGAESARLLMVTSADDDIYRAELKPPLSESMLPDSVWRRIPGAHADAALRLDEESLAGISESFPKNGMRITKTFYPPLQPQGAVPEAAKRGGGESAFGIRSSAIPWELMLENQVIIPIHIGEWYWYSLPSHLQGQDGGFTLTLAFSAYEHLAFFAGVDKKFITGGGR